MTAQARQGAHRRIPWTTRSPRRLAAGYAVATVGTALITLALLPVRAHITPLSKGFGFLTVVVVAAAVGGLGPGIVASILSFLVFNFLFLPPYNTFTIHRAEYVVVLFVYLGLSLLVSALLAAATDRAEAAEAREQEVRTLQSLGAHLVAIGPGPGGYRELLVEMREVFGPAGVALFVEDEERRELREVAVAGVRSGELSARPDLAPGSPPADRVPLIVGGRTLGLVVMATGGRALGTRRSRVLRAFCDQLALALERDRLLREATKAQVYRQADEVRRSLLAAVSHDLRTPLAAIKTSVTDLLAEDSPREGEYLTEALESINSETDRLTSLIANLLDMSRIERGMLRPRIQGVDLAETLALAAERARREWHGLTVAVHADPRAGVVRADPVFLDRVLGNLVENGAKAARESGTPTLELRSHAGRGRVVVRIVDHGPGIPQSVHEQLFYPFYQLSERHPRLGTGLGLPIAKGFLAVMGGEIWIEETPGGGATFAFSLPAEAERSEAPQRVGAGTEG